MPTLEQQQQFQMQLQQLQQQQQQQQDKKQNDSDGNASDGDSTLGDTSSSRTERTTTQSSSGTSGTKRGRDSLTEDERKEERKAANRRSAYQSRLRKKLLIEELQGKVAALSDTIQKLRNDNMLLSTELESALTENRRLRFMQIHQQDGMVGAGGGMAYQNMGGMAGTMGGMGGNMAGPRGASFPPLMDNMMAMQQQLQQQGYGAFMGNQQNQQLLPKAPHSSKLGGLEPFSPTAVGGSSR